jgi:hypothetical protein
VRCWKGWGQKGWPEQDAAVAAAAAPAAAVVQGAFVVGTRGQLEQLGQWDRVFAYLTSPSSAMTENSDKVPITMVGPEDVEFCSPPVSTSWVPRTAVE